MLCGSVTKPSGIAASDLTRLQSVLMLIPNEPFFVLLSMYLSAATSSRLIPHAVVWFPQNLKYNKFVTQD